MHVVYHYPDVENEDTQHCEAKEHTFSLETTRSQAAPQIIYVHLFLFS